MSNVIVNKLARLFKSDGDELVNGPTVVAIAVSKSHKDQYAAAIHAAGFTVEDPQADDSVAVVYKQEDTLLIADDEDLTAFQLSDNTVAMVANVSKSFSSYTDSLSFAENVVTNGFFPGVRIATEALRETIYNIMYSSEDPAEASANVAKALTEFNAYVNQLASTLPVHVFKMEQLEAIEVPGTVEPEPKTVSKTEGEGEGEGEGASTTDEDEDATASVSKTDTTSEGSEEVQAVKPAEGAEVTSKDDSTAEENTEEATVQSEEVSKGDETLQSKDENALVLQAIKGLKDELGETISTVQKGLEDLVTSTSALAGRVESVEKVSKSAQEAVEGSVLAGSIADDDLGANRESTQKSENSEDEWGGTALDNIVGETER